MLYSNDKSTADRDALASSIRRAECRAGLPITGRLHILRHTFCSRLAIRGATTKAIQEVAGHVSLTTTQRYIYLSPAANESAIRLLEIDVRGEKREIRESNTASEENGRWTSNVVAVAHGNRTHRGRLSAPATGFEDRASHQIRKRYRRGI